MKNNIKRNISMQIIMKNLFYNNTNDWTGFSAGLSDHKSVFPLVVRFYSAAELLLDCRYLVGRYVDDPLVVDHDRLRKLFATTNFCSKKMFPAETGYPGAITLYIYQNNSLSSITALLVLLLLSVPQLGQMCLFEFESITAPHSTQILSNALLSIHILFLLSL